MSPAEQKDAGLGLLEGARPAGAGAATRRTASRCARPARELLDGHRRPAELLRRARRRGPRPAAGAAGQAGAADAAERDAAAADPGFARALALIAIGLRSEGVREWNFSIRGLGDRELLAAAQLACDREVWDRCINTSDRTRAEIDIDQRFPTPLRKDVVGAGARDRPRPGVRLRPDPPGVALHHRRALGRRRVRPDAADAGDGASWTAKKIGLPYTPALIADRDTNLRLGNAYLKLVLDDVGGSQAMAAAAYNAGPGRPRKWREGPVLDAAVWVENIPFTETRDYVKKVLSQRSLLRAPCSAASGTTIRSRLGKTIGPPDPNAPPPDKDLP